MVNVLVCQEEEGEPPSISGMMSKKLFSLFLEPTSHASRLLGVAGSSLSLPPLTPFE